MRKHTITSSGLTAASSGQCWWTKNDLAPATIGLLWELNEPVPLRYGTSWVCRDEPASALDSASVSLPGPGANRRIDGSQVAVATVTGTPSSLSRQEQGYHNVVYVHTSHNPTEVPMPAHVDIA